MGDFKVGDRIRVVSEWVNTFDDSRLNGLAGTIKEISNFSQYPYFIEFDNGEEESVAVVEYLVETGPDTISKEELSAWLINRSNIWGARMYSMAEIAEIITEEFDLKTKKMVQVTFQVEVDADTELDVQDLLLAALKTEAHIKMEEI